MIEFKQVSYTYFSNYYPLMDFCYNFNKGIYQLIGDYDTGNLTLIRLIAKLDTYYKGNILIDNIDLKKVDFKQYNIAYISTNPTFFNNKSVIYNLAYPLLSRKIKKSEAYNLALQKLIDYNMEHLTNKKIKQLNFNDKLIISLLRASMRNLDILLVEDIFSLDLPNNFNIFDYVTAETTLIVTKNDLELPNSTKIHFDNKN